MKYSELMGTKKAASLLGMRPSRLSHAVWEGRIPEPERGPGGVFIWSEDDLRRAARTMLGKSLEEVRNSDDVAKAV